MDDYIPNKSFLFNFTGNQPTFILMKGDE